MVDVFRVILILGSILFLIMILVMIKKNKLSVKFSIMWIFAALIMILFACFPYLVYLIRYFTGFEVVSNLVFTMVIGFILLIILGLTSVASVFSEQIKRLSQANAILEKRVRDLEEKNKN